MPTTPGSPRASAAPRSLLLRSARGFSAVELILTLAVSGLVLALSVPPFEQWIRRTQLRVAAGEVVGALRLARTSAIRTGHKVAVKFHTEGEVVLYSLHADGDGDGVRTADIRSGTDPILGVPRPLSHFGQRIHFGFPPNTEPVAPGISGAKLERLDDPIRFNRSDLASFGPIGTSTPGSLYLTDGHHLLAVRVLNRTGRVAVVEWDRATNRWQ